MIADWAVITCMLKSVSASDELKLKILSVAEDAIRRKNVSLLKSEFRIHNEYGNTDRVPEEVVEKLLLKSGVKAFVKRRIAEDLIVESA